MPPDGGRVPIVGGRGWSEAKPRMVTRHGWPTSQTVEMQTWETRAGATRWSSPATQSELQRRNGFRRAAAGGGCGVDHGCQRCQIARREEIAERQLDAEHFADTSHEYRGLKRMAARREEIIVETDRRSISSTPRHSGTSVRSVAIAARTAAIRQWRRRRRR